MKWLLIAAVVLILSFVTKGIAHADPPGSGSRHKGPPPPPPVKRGQPVKRL